MATALAAQGLRFRIIDMAAARANESRAIGIQARTLEVLEMSGTVDEFLAVGHQLAGVTIYGETGTKIGHLTFERILSPYQFILTLAQSETERILGDYLRKRNVEIERETELVSFEQSDTGVSAQILAPNGEQEEISTDWLLGCDGVRSRVREVLNLGFSGKSYDLHFLLGDAHAESSLSDDEAHIFGRAEGLLAFFPLGKGLHRLIADIILPNGFVRRSSRRCRNGRRSSTNVRRFQCNYLTSVGLPTFACIHGWSKT